MNESVFFVLGGIWLLVLSVLYVLLYIRLGKFLGPSQKQNVLGVLEKVQEALKENESNIDKANKEITRGFKENVYNIQKVGVVRFNPFNETGGDHSFSIALLNGDDTGFLMTGLHTRERTRVYIKPVEAGKSTYELSNEEKKALKKAGEGRQKNL